MTKVDCNLGIAPTFDEVMILVEEEMFEKEQIFDVIRLLNVAVQDCDRALAIYEQDAKRHHDRRKLACR